MKRSAWHLALRTGATRRLRGACLAALLHLPFVAGAQNVVSSNPNQVEAAFLRNFARYVTWPPASFTSERAPWSVCILGDDHFDDALEKTLRGRTEQGRPFEVLRTPAPESGRRSKRA